MEMHAKGKGKKADGSIRNSSHYDAVWNPSSHSVTAVKRDFRKQCAIVPVGDEDLKEGEQHNNEETRASEARNRVKVIVDLYRQILCKLMKQNDKSVGRKTNIHQLAVSSLRSRVNYLTVERRIGDVAGIEIGDGFECRAELYITGLHLQHNNGIDYMVVDETILATSVVESSRYGNTRNSFGDLIYVGQGGNSLVNSQIKDQVMERGNLALRNSMIRKTPVRVIVKSSIQKTASYVYEGLHLVQKYWFERGSNNKYVYKFQLSKMSEQPINPRGFQCKTNKQCEHGVVMKDLSRGKEKVPIVVVNKIDDKMPPKFAYTLKSKFTNGRVWDWCDCEDGCSDSEDCSCRSKNGGKLPYDYDQCIITRRPFIYECGPPCKCFDSCLNKVSQRGIRTELEVFRTESKRWGVRSRKRIPRGSFVCEYVGETVSLKVGNQNGIGDNEYMFVVGSYKKDSCIEDDEVLAIDASRNGNVGRFVQRSCSPNLFVQKVYISLDVTTPHILLFATEDIKPLEELTYEYNWRFKM